MPSSVRRNKISANTEKGTQRRFIKYLLKDVLFANRDVILQSYANGEINAKRGHQERRKANGQAEGRA